MLTEEERIKLMTDGVRLAGVIVFQKTKHLDWQGATAEWIFHWDINSLIGNKSNNQV